MFCKHKWKVLHKGELGSLYDNMKEVGHTPHTAYKRDFIRVLVLVLCCEKCGKLKVIRQETAFRYCE